MALMTESLYAHYMPEADTLTAEEYKRFHNQAAIGEAVGLALSTDTTPPSSPPRDNTWQERSACLGLNPNIFETKQKKQQERAKEICAGCPVVEPCLEDALNKPSTSGIRGGTNGAERKKIRKERAAQTQD